MPRAPRFCQYGGHHAIYYVTVSGNNNQNIFTEAADYELFLRIISARKEKYDFNLYAFCLLPNGYQLLIEPGQKASISKIMQALNTSYVLYFNNRHNRTGHLLSNRFQSLVIAKDRSLLEIIQRIHLIPLDTKLTTDIKGYKWSSYLEYMGLTPLNGLVDIPNINPLSFTCEDIKSSIYKQIISQYYNLIGSPEGLTEKKDGHIYRECYNKKNDSSVPMVLAKEKN